MKMHNIARAVFAAVFLAAGAIAVHTTVHAAAPIQKKQAAGYFRTMVGDFEVTALYDGGVGLDSSILGGDAAQNRSLIERASDDPKRVSFSVAGYLVNTGAKLVLIDAGTGGHWGGPSLGKLATNLRAAGHRPEQVDFVLLTHGHADHAGGITSTDGKRVFPNAQIKISKADSDFWLSKEIASKAPEEAQIFFKAARDVAAPYQAAGTWSPFEGTGEIVPGIKPFPIGGHTPGHTGYEISSNGQSLLVWGDVVHMAAVQIPHPEVGIAYDIDSPAAIKAREALFETLAANKTLVAGAHMPWPGLGRLRKETTGYTWLPIPFKDM